MQGEGNLISTLWCVEYRDSRGQVMWEILPTRGEARAQARYWRCHFGGSPVKTYKVTLVYEHYR